MLDHITPVILCFNEEDNLPRTLKALAWARRVLIIDSGSTDDSLAICADFANVEVVHNPFESFAQQCNFALRQNIVTDWVLSMDADYVLTDELVSELAQLDPNSEYSAFAITFSYLIDGTPLRGSLYPPRVSLYRHQSSRYAQDGHAHRVQIQGEIGALSEKIQHDDRKPYERWISAQKRYALQEATKLKETSWEKMNTADKLRWLGVSPIIIWPYTLIWKKLALDGWAGFKYCRQRFTAEWLLFKALRQRN